MPACISKQRGAPLATDFALTRYAADGSLDSGFGAGGIVTTAIGSGADEAHALVVVAGRTMASATAPFGGQHIRDDFAIVRYLP